MTCHRRRGRRQRLPLQAGMLGLETQAECRQTGHGQLLKSYVAFVLVAPCKSHSGQVLRRRRLRHRAKDFDSLAVAELGYESGVPISIH